MMRLSTWIILSVTVVLNLFIWVGINKPHSPVESAYPMYSVSLNPFKKNQSPFDQHVFTAEELDSDLKLLAGKTRTVRLYASTHGLEMVPEIARRYKLFVMMTAYLEDNPDQTNNQKEVESVIRLAGVNRNVVRVIVGNETQLHKTVPREQLVEYLRQARKALRTPVSTAEPWDYWINHPEMADEVDFIAIHILPYWQKIPIEEAVDYILGKYEAVKRMFPDKIVVIAEAGWPSSGPQHGAAKATQANQADFVRSFIRRAESLHLRYNLFEAFDQPWKSATEGEVGEHWGIMNADRQEKFPMQGPVLEDPNWKYWALSSTVVGFLATSLFLFRRRDVRKRGQIFSVIIFQVLVALVTQLARQAADQYMSPGDIAFWSIMSAAQTLLAIILVTDAMEIAEVVGDAPLTRRFLPQRGAMVNAPMVSIHVACCREPADLMIATVNSLAALRYPNFEVIVVDNNTPDPAQWEPVQQRCAALGAHIRFFHLPHCDGFKAGALNFALRQTNSAAKVIGVVDADYVVQPEWLEATIPYFSDPNVGHVQAPQEHRGWSDSIFQRMENDEYSGFFRIGMVQRNEDNAIIQHGTMMLVDRATLDRLGGWAEWCIGEDTELGLRILAEGKQGIYLDHPLGHGLVPDTYDAYAKQRFRWAYGAMRIMRHHWKTLCGLQGQLTRSQRYHFVRGWLPWIGDALHMIFSATAMLWSVVLMIDPLYTAFPQPIFIYPALLLVLVRIFGTIWTYSARVKIGKKRTLLALIAGGSLTHKIAKAVWQGLLGFKKPFYRTPKMEGVAPLWQNLRSVQEEIALTIILWTCAGIMLGIFGTINGEALIWSVALVVQTIPYVAAIIAAVVSSLATRVRTSSF